MAEGQSTTEMKTTNSETPSQNPSNNPFFFLSLIPKFLLKPFVNNNNNKNVKVENGKSVERVDEQENTATTAIAPEAVKFPLTHAEVPPIKLENDDVQEDTNPLILWQVYALGGFIILKWAWGKWQERKGRAKKDSSGEEQPPPSPPAPAPAED